MMIKILSSSKNLIWVAAVIAGIISGCSVTDEKGQQESEAVVKEKVQESQPPAKAAEPETPKEEESVVEVTPGTSKGADLKVEPIPEPLVPEPPVSESPVKEVEEMPAEGSVAKKPQEEDKPQVTEPAEAMATQEPPAPKKDVPVSTGPDHFVVTARIKDQSHPLFGKGHKMGFVVNNEQGKEVVLERGKTYRFDIATDPKHDVYISLKEIGWGSVPYSKGIEGMYTYKGTMTIKPDKDTPGILFYSCRNHPYMGGKIHIVNPGEKIKIAKSTAKSATPVSSTKKAVSKADVNQKIMFANMLMTSKNTKSILSSNISEAVDMYKKAEKALESAKSQLKDGSNDKAYKNAESAIALLKKSSKLVPNESQLALMKERNKEIIASLKDFEDSHKENYERVVKKQGKDAAVNYDKDKVAKLKGNASDLAKKGDYGKANKNLEEAQRLVTTAIHKMLDKQTIVYDLNFESAEEEYEYELKRFEGYAELIPIAVEQKKPAEGAKKLMESFVDKGKKLRDRAKKKAKEGDFPTAIAMMQDATKDVRRGLRMIGVSQ